MQVRCKCPATGIGGLSSVSLVLVAAHAVPQLVLAAPSHVSPILTTVSGGTTWIADATGGIQHRIDPPAISFKRDPNPQILYKYGPLS